jgi:hypothetical protein
MNHKEAKDFITGVIGTGIDLMNTSEKRFYE